MFPWNSMKGQISGLGSLNNITQKFTWNLMNFFEVLWAMTRTRRIVGTTTAKWQMSTWWQQRYPGPTAEMTETETKLDRIRATLGALARLALHQVCSLEKIMRTSIVSLRFNARESKKCSKLVLQLLFCVGLHPKHPSSFCAKDSKNLPWRPSVCRSFLWLTRAKNNRPIMFLF